MVKRKLSVHGLTCSKHGAGEGNTGLPVGLTTKLQQNNLVDIGRLGVEYKPVF